MTPSARRPPPPPRTASAARDRRGDRVVVDGGRTRSGRAAGDRSCIDGASLEPIDREAALRVFGPVTWVLSSRWMATPNTGRRRAPRSGSGAGSSTRRGAQHVPGRCRQEIDARDLTVPVPQRWLILAVAAHVELVRPMTSAAAPAATGVPQRDVRRAARPVQSCDTSTMVVRCAGNRGSCRHLR